MPPLETDAGLRALEAHVVGAAGVLPKLHALAGRSPWVLPPLARELRVLAELPEGRIAAAASAQAPALRDLPVKVRAVRHAAGLLLQRVEQALPLLAGDDSWR